MNLNTVLARLKAHQIEVQEEKQGPEGERIITVGCPLPSIPFGANRFVYTTIVLSNGEDTIPRAERDAIRRRLWHLNTDIFGDDAMDEKAESAIPEPADSDPS